MIKISFKANESLTEKLEEEFRRICPKMKRVGLKKDSEILTCTYKLEGGKSKFKELQKMLVSNSYIVGFET